MWSAFIDRLRGRYRGMDRATLDAQYSPSRCVDAIEPFLARWAEDSAAARESARAAGRLREDLAYGTHDEAALDVFLPAARAPAPALIYLHGGYWQMLSRKDSAFAAPALTAAGAVYVAAGYTLAPEASLAQIVAQVRAAIVWVWRHADEIGVDRERIYLAGMSAGAHLAAMALLTRWPAHGVPADLIKGVCAVSGIYDLAPIRLTYVDGPLGLSRADVAALSPLGVTPPVRCPVLVAWGDNETDEFKRQSRAYAAALRADGVPVRDRELTGRHHFDAILDLNDPQSWLGGRTLAMMGLAA